MNFIVASTGLFAEGGGGALGGLGINTMLIVAQAINFIFLVLLLNTLLFRPLLKNLDARRKRIDESLENARMAEEKLANIEKDYQAKMTQAATEAQKLRTEALQSAQAEIDRVRKEAVVEAERIKGQARIDATAERNTMLGDLRGQVAAIAMAAANKIVGESLDQQRQMAIINDFFSKVPSAGGVKIGDGGSLAVTSAVPLSADEQGKIKSDLAKQFGSAGDVSFDVNPAILGGLIIKAGDKVIDGSVAARMTALKQSLNA